MHEIRRRTIGLSLFSFPLVYYYDLTTLLYFVYQHNQAGNSKAQPEEVFSAKINVTKVSHLYSGSSFCPSVPGISLGTLGEKSSH